MIPVIPEERKSLLLRQLAKGFPVGELKEELYKEGYSKEAIDACFAPKKYDMRSWYLFFGLLLISSGVWLFIVYNTFLPLILGILLLIEYYREQKKIKTLNRS